MTGLKSRVHRLETEIGRTAHKEHPPKWLGEPEEAIELIELIERGVAENETAGYKPEPIEWNTPLTYWEDKQGLDLLIDYFGWAAERSLQVRARLDSFVSAH